MSSSSHSFAQALRGQLEVMGYDIDDADDPHLFSCMQKAGGNVERAIQEWFAGGGNTAESAHLSASASTAELHPFFAASAGSSSAHAVPSSKRPRSEGSEAPQPMEEEQAPRVHSAEEYGLGKTQQLQHLLGELQEASLLGKIERLFNKLVLEDLPHKVMCSDHPCSFVLRL